METPEVVIELEDYITALDRALAFHGHICPGMYNGVKMALGARQILGLPSYPDKNLIVVTETDRCITDALMITTGCRLGRKTLKFRDIGKFAATFVLLGQNVSFRLCQKDGIVRRAMNKLEEEGIDYHDHQKGAAAFLEVPFFEHFSLQSAEVAFAKEDLPGRLEIKVNCDNCAETVMDNRHVIFSGQKLCKTCRNLLQCCGD